MEMAQSWKRLGQNCDGMGRQRILDERRKKKSTPADKNIFVTFAFDSVKMSTVHRKEKRQKGKERRVKEKTRRDLGPADTTTREDGPAVQLGGDSDVTCIWINGPYSLAQKCRGRSGQVQKTCTPGGQSDFED